MPSLLLCLLFFSFTTNLSAQNEQEKQKIIARSNVTALNKLSTLLKQDFYKQKKKADSLATIFNWEKIIKNDVEYSE